MRFQFGWFVGYLAITDLVYLFFCVCFRILARPLQVFPNLSSPLTVPVSHSRVYYVRMRTDFHSRLSPHLVPIRFFVFNKPISLAFVRFNYHYFIIMSSKVQPVAAPKSEN